MGDENLAIIQARMGSQRLPGKVLRTLGDRPVIDWVVSRARATDRIDDVVVATSTSEDDEEIERWCSEHDVPCHRGPEEDVLARFHPVVEKRDPEIVTRLTADCPFLDASLCDKIIETFQDRSGADYVATGHRYPEGFGVEVIHTEVLRLAHHRAETETEREHVTPFIWENPGKFDVVRVEPDVDLSEFRATLDYPADLEVLRTILERHEGPPETLDLDAVVGILRQDPALSEKNSHVAYQAGYEGAPSSEG